MSDTEMTLAEAVLFLNTKLGKRGRPSKAYSEQKERAVAIVNASTVDGKLPGAVPVTVAPVVTKTPEAQKKDDDTINGSLASLNDTPTGVNW